VHPNAVVAAADDGAEVPSNQIQGQPNESEVDASPDVASALAEVFTNPLSGPRRHSHEGELASSSASQRQAQCRENATAEAAEPERAQPSVAPVGSPAAAVRPQAAAPPPPSLTAEEQAKNVDAPSPSPCTWDRTMPSLSVASGASSLAAEPSDASTIAASDLNSAFEGTFSNPPSDCPNDGPLCVDDDAGANASELPSLREETSGAAVAQDTGSCDDQHVTESFADVSRSPGTFSPPPHPHAAGGGRAVTPNEPLTTSSNSRAESGLGAADDAAAAPEPATDLLTAALKPHDDAWIADVRTRKSDSVRGWLVAISDELRPATARAGA
jgi:hypothetical protein